MDREFYYNIPPFLNDEEIHEIWEIVGNALHRGGYDGDNGELSIRVYDSELNSVIDEPLKEVSHVHRRKDLDLL